MAWFQPSASLGRELASPTGSKPFMKHSSDSLRTRSFYGEISICQNFGLRRLKWIRSSLTAENPKSNSGLLYNAMSCLPSQVHSRKEVPRRALIYLLSQRNDWHLSKDVVQELAEADTPAEIEQYQGLPSEST